jgi:hypothetical protein
LANRVSTNPRDYHGLVLDGLTPASTTSYLYFITEEMLDSKTKNVVLREMKKAVCHPVSVTTSIRHKLPGPEAVGVIYDGTISARDPARRFTVLLWSMDYQPVRLQQNAERLLEEFMAEMLEAAMSNSGSLYLKLDSEDIVKSFMEKELDLELEAVKDTSQATGAEDETTRFCNL